MRMLLRGTVTPRQARKTLITMKLIVVLATVLAAALAMPADTYDPKFDNFNAEEIAANERLLKGLGLCFLKKGPCTAEGADIRKVIPEAVKTQCGKCTPKQKELVKIVIRGFQTKLPDLWEQIKNQEDPEGIYIKDFEKFLNSPN